MNDLSPPSLDPAQGADVLATIRRLLAQDAAAPDSAARNGALRRRLIGTRRQGGALARHLGDDALPLGEGADPEAGLPQPLRLADDQRVAAPVANGADALAGEVEASEETTPSLDSAPESEPLPEAAASAAEDTEPLPFSMPSVPRMAVSGTVPPLSGAVPFLHDVPNSDAAAAGAWAISAAADPADRLRELLTFQAWIGADGADATAAEPTAEAGQPVIEPEAQPAPEPEVHAEVAPQAEAPAEGTALLRLLIRDTLSQELAGETGTQLGEAIRQLAREAIAGALADLARGMTVPAASQALADR